MSKENTLAERPKGKTTLAVTGPQVLGILEGEEPSDFMTPRAHLFQGTTIERDIFGDDFKAGDLIDVVTGEKIKSMKFLVVRGFKDWADVDKKTGLPIKVSRNRKDWPDEETNWEARRAAGFDDPPPIQERINFVCLFENEGWPLLLRFKRTGLGAGKLLNQMLKKHGGRVMYELSSRPGKPGEGNYKYLVPVVKPAGPAPDDLYRHAVDLCKNLDDREIVVNEGTIGDTPGDTPGETGRAGLPF